MGVWIWVLLALALILVVVVLGHYNSLVAVRNHCEEAWANIDTELKRRHDLIPNLVNTVKGFAAQEKTILEEITRLRASCLLEDKPSRARAAKESALSGKLGQLMVQVEAYPNLTSSDNFLQLQEELTHTEDRIQAALRFYNGNVRENNNKVQMFPSNLIAGMFRFETRDYFEINEPGFRDKPVVEF